MQKKLLKSVFAISIIVMMTISFNLSIENNSTNSLLLIKNIVAVAMADNNESGGGTYVECNTNWKDCWWGCETKYRCNVITPCYEIMAKYSCGEDDNCIPQ